MSAAYAMPADWERDLFAKRVDTRTRVGAMSHYGWEKVDLVSSVSDWQVGKWFGEWLDERRPDGHEPSPRQVVLEDRLAAAGWERTTIASPNAAWRPRQKAQEASPPPAPDPQAVDALKRSALRLFRHGVDAQPGDDQ